MTKGITSISVCGYKSLAKKVTIEVRPLTILAGANSSGKSSIMQTLLMMKQTLDESYDPGDLKINGPNVKFTSVDQLLSKSPGKKKNDSFQTIIEFDGNKSIQEKFKKVRGKGIELTEMIYRGENLLIKLNPKMTHEEIVSANPIAGDYLKNLTELLAGRRTKGRTTSTNKQTGNFYVKRNRCFFEIAFDYGHTVSSMTGLFFDVEDIAMKISKIIHVPALRGNPKRNYDVAAVGRTFPGTFENYISNVINAWQINHDKRLESLGGSLEELGLTWKVIARPVDDTNVEILVGRLPHSARGGAQDLVSIADVGFGVSQTMPVLVALLEAEPGQLVYIEQPEIHLHPRAQVAMAQILAKAAKRGVQVVVETHSSFLLKGIQTLVAEGSLSPDIVKLHWFQRGEDGITEVRSANLDKAGAFGDWPEDFADIELEAEKRYLDAATLQLEMV